MSLIEQALRRIKDPIVSQSPPSEPTPADAPRPSAQKPKRPAAHPWSVASSVLSRPETELSAGTPATRLTITVVGLVCALAILLLIGGTQWMRRTLSTISPTAPTPAGPETAAAPIAEPILRPALSASQPPPELALTGIVAGAGEPYAVINGSIIMVGEFVNGWVLTAITDQSVTLRRNDEERTLRVPRS